MVGRGCSKVSTTSSVYLKAKAEKAALTQHMNTLEKKHALEVQLIQQHSASIPPRVIPIFDGDPFQYGPFVMAFKQGIKRKISNAPSYDDTSTRNYISIVPWHGERRIQIQSEGRNFDSGFFILAQRQTGYMKKKTTKLSSVC